MRIVSRASQVAVLLGITLFANSAFALRGWVFVHGTGNYSAPTAGSGSGGATAYYSYSSSATGSYWSQSSINSMRGAASSTSGEPYIVVGYSGATCAADASCAWSTVADQAKNWASANGVTSIVMVTHSNGINPVRYMAAHRSASANVTWLLGATGAATGRVKRILNIAGDGKGTPLADKVTTGGNVASIINSMFLGGSYSGAAVLQQVQSTMNTKNSNGTFDMGGATLAGVTTTALRGTAVYVNWFSSESNCGGWAETNGLWAARCYGWSCGACSDGFIGCASAEWNGTLRTSGYKPERSNHNQSRRSCVGMGGTVTAEGALAPLTATPADYTVPPSTQACDTTGRGTSAYNSNYWLEGCTSSMLSNGVTDFDCVTGYGADNGVVAPNDYLSTAYSNPAYYAGGVACPDSWLGDGECDLCLIAKYGYDASNGGTTVDDCVVKPTNWCYDLAYYTPTAVWTIFGYPMYH